jgi:hypothetical protein
VKRRKKDRSRPLKDKKGHLKFHPSCKGHIQKTKNAATPLPLYLFFSLSLLSFFFSSLLPLYSLSFLISLSPSLSLILSLRPAGHPGHLKRKAMAICNTCDTNKTCQK